MYTSRGKSGKEEGWVCRFPGRETWHAKGVHCLRAKMPLPCFWQGNGLALSRILGCHGAASTDGSGKAGPAPAARSRSASGGNGDFPFRNEMQRLPRSGACLPAFPARGFHSRPVAFTNSTTMIGGHR